jgi:hypothetical protein
MIFVLDNGLDYEDHGLTFVEAEPSFEAWLMGPFDEWRKRRGLNGFTIVATAREIELRGDGVVFETAEEFRHHTREYIGPPDRFADPPPLPK